MWKFSLPLLISLIFVLLTIIGAYYLIFPAMLLANGLNWVWGEFSGKDAIKKLQLFYSNRNVRIMKRVNAVGLILMICWGVYFFDRYIFGAGNIILFTIATGCLTGCFIVTLAHDLLHGRFFIDKLLSNGLLLISGIPHLAGDHVFGHHRDIGLKKDASTAPLNRDFYTYFFRIFLGRIKNSFSSSLGLPQYIEKKIRWQNITMLCCLIALWLIILVTCKRPGSSLLFFISQGLVAYILYELINYIQHYGLTRKDENTPISLYHSWNCYYKYTNYILYMLPLHSLHHLPTNARKQREEQILCGPKMPFVYFTMVFMALVPPIWFKYINPLARKYNEVNC